MQSVSKRVRRFTAAFAMAGVLTLGVAGFNGLAPSAAQTAPPDCQTLITALQNATSLIVRVQLLTQFLTRGCTVSSSTTSTAPTTTTTVPATTTTAPTTSTTVPSTSTTTAPTSTTTTTIPASVIQACNTMRTLLAGTTDPAVRAALQANIVALGCPPANPT
ncbi:MAG: hypothetical protein QOE93_1323 [Actinomycetota bacterium]|jgi:hypothetical protein|nr:hypothetical protein [Actinomycetota bacterium]